MNRTSEFRRDARHHAICRKKSIALSRDGSDWYKHDGQYDKGKIHCGCGICKFGKKYGYETTRTMRELEKFNLDMKDYIKSA